MHMKKNVLIFLLLSITSCKTTAPVTSNAELETYDGLGSDADLPPSQDFWFCPKSRTFNMYNAYWLAEAALMTYSKRVNIDKLNKKLSGSWKSTVVYISSDDPHSTLEPDVQAVWVENDFSAVLAFRGTVNRTLNNLITDFDVPRVPFLKGTPEFGSVHHGFQTALDSIWPQIAPRLAALQATKKPFFLSGHSLGGALATLTVARIVLLKTYESLAQNNLMGLYTYGSPPIGNGTFVKEFELSRISLKIPFIRFRNHDDFISQAHTQNFFLFDPYVHAGTLFYFDELGKLYTDEPSFGLVRYKMPADISQGLAKPHKFHVDQYSDHSLLEYIRKLSNEYSVIQGSADRIKAERCSYEAIYNTPRS